MPSNGRIETPKKYGTEIYADFAKNAIRKIFKAFFKTVLLILLSKILQICVHLRPNIIAVKALHSPGRI
jgi:hypothetical protein